MAYINVKNNCNGYVGVRVTQWGPEGDTAIYSIKGGDSDRWGRDDSRGYIMTVYTYDDVYPWTVPYFVLPGSDITINEPPNGPDGAGPDWSKGQVVLDGLGTLQPAGTGGNVKPT